MYDWGLVRGHTMFSYEFREGAEDTLETYFVTLTREENRSVSDSQRSLLFLLLLINLLSASRLGIGPKIQILSALVHRRE